METLGEDGDMAGETLDLGEFVSGHDFDIKRFTSAFFAEEDIAAMVRCHFEVERAAIRSLDVLTGGRWEKVRSQYLSEKLNLLEMIGAPPKLLAPARTINNQRNEFAHKGWEEISEQQMLDVVRGVRAFFPQFHDDYDVIFHGKRKFNAKFHECSIRQRYVLTTGILTMFIGGLPEIMRIYFSKKHGPVPSSPE